VVKVSHLKKVYSTGFAAVKDNSFYVKKGEVLGLLGPNGAGKSTTFNMLTLDLQRSSGKVTMLGNDLDKISAVEHGKRMGMCPQFNTIWEVMTVDECLVFVGEVKGLSPADIQFQSQFIKDTLDLQDFSKTRAGALSGGNKRKLVCAMSLIACPELEFLDEPTTGVDPVSRRSLFKMLKSLQDSSLVLTTHRMDEAESLCDKIAIMINGRFVCYGSPSYLKSTYGKSYSLKVKHVN